MEECESLDSEMTELQEFQHGASETISQDDEDEVEELQNSLREVVQDQSVKPKLQCLMVDPSFSMVTVQSEDSGIVWETASSRCSTPWASETSSISEAYSMEGSGAAGKITIVFDEDKVVRRRTRSGGRSSRLGDRLSRPGSSRSASALGVERLEMAEVSVPNVKQQKTESEPDLEGIKNKDQQLFSLISEGYEILNIRVPSKLPTVDEEESTELQDNLSYLDQTPKIRSRNHQDWTLQQNHVLPEEEKTLDHQKSSEQDSSQPAADKELRHTPIQKDSTSDIDYFEKFTLVPGERAPELQDKAEQPPAKPQTEGQKPTKDTAPEDISASEDSFVIVSDVDIVGEHLDEVFYGEGPPADERERRDYQAEGEPAMRRRRESQRSGKESGSVLFGSEETILTPIFISPGPPKIIDPILLEEPTAMSFMYSDLYEDAVGERRKSDEEHSEAESVVSEKTYKRRLSDSEEADGYLEKFILKDETPAVEVRPQTPEDCMEGRMMWSQSKFEMTGCLTRVISEEDKEKTKTEEPETKEIICGESSEDAKSETFEEKRKIAPEKGKEADKIELSMEAEKLSSKEATKESFQESNLRDDQMGDQEIKRKVKKDQTEPPESSTDEVLPRAEQVDCKEEKSEDQRELLAQSVITEGDQLDSQTHKDLEDPTIGKTTEARAVTTTASTEVSCISRKSDAPSESTEKSLPEKAATDTLTVAAGEKSVIVATAEVKELGSEGQELFSTAETEIFRKTPLHEGEEEEDVVPDNVASVEVITDCHASVQAVVEVTEKAVDDKEVQTQVQIDLQEVKHAEEEDVQAAVLEEERKAPTEQTAAGGQVSKSFTEADQEREDRAVREAIQPATPEEIKIGSEKTQHETEAKLLPQERTVTESASAKAKLIPEQTTSTKDSESKVQELAKEELIVLVPKGQAVEMDIEISQFSEKIEGDTVAPPEALSTFEDLTDPHASITIETQQLPNDETKAEPQLEIIDSDIQKEPRNELDIEDRPPAPVEEDDVEEQKVEWDSEKDEGVFSPLRSFSPQEDLSALLRQDMQSDTTDVEQKVQMTEDVMETNIVGEILSQQTDLYREDKENKVEPREKVVEAPEVMVEEPGYEVIYEQDAKEMLGWEKQRDAEEPKPEPGQEEVKGVGPEVKMEEEKVFGLYTEDEFIEDDYDIIDAEEERLARLAAELQGMDWFCFTCGYLLSDNDCAAGEHHSHEVTSVDSAYEEIKDKLSDWISELQGRSENIEDLVSELELAYNSVEDHCVETEAVMQAQNEEMMALVMEQYNNMSISMEEEKKAKLEQLYDQIVSFQDSIDSAKATLETTAREAETEARSPEDIHARLKAALESAMSLELGPRGLLVFEDYAKGNTSGTHLAQRKGIPVPQSPTLQPQEPGSATSTSVTAYWKVNPGDIIDCFQVYCMEDPQGVVSEEYRVTVKESYCVLEELEPDKTYKVWVMAVNYTGCSLPSERLSFRTAPSVPVIDTEHCTVMWDSATLRWSSTKQTPEQNYTLEYCRQYELEGEGLRSISGIKSCEQRVFLQPCENYLFYIKAVNEAGASEQSEAALISTKGTKFRLLRASAHPALELSADQSVLHYSHDSSEDTLSTDRQCPSILGELLPPKGCHYWETVVSGSTAYRLGVAYSTANRNSPLGENSLSWCLQCVPAPSGCRYQLLHGDVRSSMFVTEVPERVGTLLDYQLGHLCFYNAQSGQLLGSFCQRFTKPCHPVLALEMPGSLEVSMAPEVPEFTKDR